MDHSVRSAADSVADETSPLTLPHAAADCPKCLVEAQQDGQWWLARPEGARLVGLVVSRPGLPSVAEQRESFARFGVPIEGFRHPMPQVTESWDDRISRSLRTVARGDVLVVADVHALGEDRNGELRTLRDLQQRGVIVKVMSHGARHLTSAE